jgi:hypothetical protein
VECAVCAVNFYSEILRTQTLCLDLLQCGRRSFDLLSQTSACAVRGAGFSSCNRIQPSSRPYLLLRVCSTCTNALSVYSVFSFEKRRLSAATFYIFILQQILTPPVIAFYQERALDKDGDLNNCLADNLIDRAIVRGVKLGEDSSARYII